MNDPHILVTYGSIGSTEIRVIFWQFDSFLRSYVICFRLSASSSIIIKLQNLAFFSNINIILVSFCQFKFVGFFSADVNVNYSLILNIKYSLIKNYSYNLFINEKLIKIIVVLCKYLFRILLICQSISKPIYDLQKIIEIFTFFQLIYTQ